MLDNGEIKVTIMDTKSFIEDTNREMRYKHFLSLLLDHKTKIYGYILALLPHPSVALDVMQETVMVMWEKFDDFTPGTNFPAWGKAIAYNKIRACRRELSKTMYFDDEVLDSLASEPQQDENGVKIEALQTCIKRLSKTETKLISLRFTDQMKINDIARSWGKPVNDVYRRMSKILYVLRECIQEKLSLLEAD
jgi:RNA polymerase sigma-70 factor (ECF subfamily)